MRDGFVANREPFRAKRNARFDASVVLIALLTPAAPAIPAPPCPARARVPAAAEQPRPPETACSQYSSSLGPPHHRFKLGAWRGLLARAPPSPGRDLPQAPSPAGPGHPRASPEPPEEAAANRVCPDPSQAELRLRALGPHFPCGQAPLSTPATSSNPARASPAVPAPRRPPPRSPAAARVLCGPTLEPRHSRALPLPSEVSTTSPLVSGTGSSPPRPPPVAASPPASSSPRGSVRARSPPPRHRLLPAAGQHLPRTSPTCCSHHRPERPPPDRRRPSLAPTAPVRSLRLRLRETVSALYRWVLRSDVGTVVHAR
ncbi:vegetative cell wall protein gp1-like [Ananas comosus]|uniref:Vegetative cell wall protein gp1-like n=1 Tax=Ananas comosus TaxID=4615 RepID=A0A6P5GCJ6_ANACO|nr:vegetative cell wall protein gp1-like [Ananas comosus]